MLRKLPFLLIVAAALAGCPSPSPTDAGDSGTDVATDRGPDVATDTPVGMSDTGNPETGEDSSTPDVTVGEDTSASADTGNPETGEDSSVPDVLESDAFEDSTVPDVELPDAAVDVEVDAGPADAGEDAAEDAGGACLPVATRCETTPSACCAGLTCRVAFVGSICTP